MDSPCAGCDGRCCVGRSVQLGVSDVGRLQATVGLPWAAFAAVVSDDAGFALAPGGPRYGFRLRHAADASCVFAVQLGATRRCGVHGVRPLSCRVYPWHVALVDAAALTSAAASPSVTTFAADQAAPAAPEDAVPSPELLVALGNDAACPPPLADAWRARLDAERAALTAAVAAAAADDDARARWNDAVDASGRRHLVDDYLAFVARSPR